MNRDAFVSMVGRLSMRARKRPRLYRLQAILLTLAGYSYLWLVVSALLGACMVGVFYQWKHGYNHAVSKLGIAALALAVPALRALAKRVPPPAGRAVTNAEAPLLFKELDELRRGLRAPRLHRVFLDARFNASVEQYPRVGVLGWSLNCLYLGVPLMLTLDAKGMRAVLAHELGHLASSHGWLGAWVYRTNGAWLCLLEHLEKSKRWGTGVFTRFFSGYAPYFDAFTFVLRREQEYEADRHAAQATSAPLMARTLMRVELRERFLDERFWPRLTGQYRSAPDPPTDVYEQMGAIATAPLPDDEAGAWLPDALARVTAYNDSHPSLADRLAALGWEAGEGPSSLEHASPSSTAAEAYLGDSLASVLQGFSQEWAIEVGDKWRERHAAFQADTGTLSDLANRAMNSTLSDEDAWERARLTESIEGPEAARPLLEELVRRNPAHASAQFALGRILLEEGDHTGLQHLDRVLEIDPDVAATCLRLAGPHLMASGQAAKVETYRRLAQEAQERRSRVEAEINDVANAQTYRPHGLSDSSLAALRRQLEGYSKLGAVYIVRRDLPSSPHEPHYVVGLVPRRTLGLWTNWTEAVATRDEICAAVDFPDAAKVILQRPVFRSAFEVMQRLPGSTVFER